MGQFMLFVKGGYETTREFTPEEMQQAIARYGAWAGKLAGEGKLVGAERLKEGTGRVISERDGQVVVDGPFAETKETIGGYFIINANGYDEAIEIAKECPILTEGGSVEVREVDVR